MPVRADEPAPTSVLMCVYNGLWHVFVWTRKGMLPYVVVQHPYLGCSNPYYSAH